MGCCGFAVQVLISARCRSLGAIRAWVNGPAGQNSPVPEVAANAALILIRVASSLLARQIVRLATDFEEKGGFTERLYQVRSKARRNKTGL